MKYKKKNPNNDVTREELIKKAKLIGIKYIDLRYDFAFKTIFGTPGNEDLLLMLINAILPEKNIKSVILTRLVNFFTCVNDFFSQFARN